MPLSLDIDENFDDLIDFENDETTSSTINIHRNESSINSTIYNNSNVDTLSTLFDENALDVDSAKGNITDGSGFDLG